MTNKTDVMRGEFDVWAVENRLSLNDRLYGAVVWNAALQSPAVRELVEEARAMRNNFHCVLDVNCKCSEEFIARQTEDFDKALANFVSIAKVKGDGHVE